MVYVKEKFSQLHLKRINLELTVDLPIHQIFLMVEKKNTILYYYIPSDLWSWKISQPSTWPWYWPLSIDVSKYANKKQKKTVLKNVFDIISFQFKTKSQSMRRYATIHFFLQKKKNLELLIISHYIYASFACCPFTIIFYILTIHQILC